MPAAPPPRAVAPVRPDPGERATARPAHTAEPDASHLEPLRGTGWRQLLAAGVVGAIVGAAIPGGIELGERAAANADEAGLRQVATAYLAAIADGRASDASAMVPLPARAEEATDAALQSARRIDAAEVRLVRVDGDIGSVEVRYEVGAVETARTLDAERVAGDWWLTTSLAEPVEAMYFSFDTQVSLAGTPLVVGRPLHLYPGLYEVDETESPIMRVRSEPFAVDGDTATPTEVFVDAQLTPEVHDDASALGLAVARECQAAPSCEIPPEVELEVAHAAVYGGADGWLDLGVQLASADVQQQWFEVRLRLETDAEGAPARWLCAPPGDHGDPADPCPLLP